VEEEFKSALAAHQWLTRALRISPFATGDGQIVHLDRYRKETVLYQFADHRTIATPQLSSESPKG
jgi:hypothetical protein